MARRSLAAATALLMLAGTVHGAEVIAGKWQKVDLLTAGSPILIKTIYAEQVECLYFSSNRETLLIVETHGVQRRISKEVIETVTALEYDDTLANGMVLGLAAGLCAALLMALVPRDPSASNRATTAVFGGVLFGLSGMGIGALADFHHKGREVLYRAPSPRTGSGDREKNPESSRDEFPLIQGERLAK